MVIINDTNIWIDLKLTNIIEKVFLLPYELAVPDILYNDELKDMDGELLEANGIKIIEMTNDEVVETAERSGMTNRVSFNDLTTLVVAKSRGYILVTGDGNLRKIAKSENVELRGTIWLIDEMVSNNILDIGEAALICKKLLQLKRRLPKEELQLRIKRWMEEVAID